MDKVRYETHVYVYWAVMNLSEIIFTFLVCTPNAKFNQNPWIERRTRALIISPSYEY